MSLLRKCALKAKCPKPLENRPRILSCQCTHNPLNCFVVSLDNFKPLHIMFGILQSTWEKVDYWENIDCDAHLFLSRTAPDKYTE